MSSFIAIGNSEDDLYLAGERVTAGLYREIESGREVRFASEDYLPATHDGRVAAYARSHPAWGQGHSPANSAHDADHPPASEPVTTDNAVIREAIL